MNWKKFFKDITIGVGVIAALGIAATIGWETALAHGFGLLGKVVVGGVTAVVLALLGKKAWNARTEEKLAVPVIVNTVPPAPEKKKQKENQIEYEHQVTLTRQRPKRRFLGRNPAKFVARWRSKKAQQKENQHERV